MHVHLQFPPSCSTTLRPSLLNKAHLTKSSTAANKYALETQWAGHCEREKGVPAYWALCRGYFVSTYPTQWGHTITQCRVKSSHSRTMYINECHGFTDRRLFTLHQPTCFCKSIFNTIPSIRFQCNFK